MDFQSAKNFGKLRLRAFQPYHKYYICWYCRYKTRISNTSMLSMLTQSIQFSHLIVLCIRCCVRATNTSVDKHSFKCIACFDLHIDSVNTQDTILNTQQHCFDLLYRPSRHAFMSIQTTMQILIQSLRITVKFDLNPWFTSNYKRVWIKTSN